MNDTIVKLEAENAALKAELQLLKEAETTRLIRDCSSEQKRYVVGLLLKHGTGNSLILACQLYMALFGVDMCTAYEEVEKLKDV